MIDRTKISTDTRNLSFKCPLKARQTLQLACSEVQADYQAKDHVFETVEPH